MARRGEQFAVKLVVVDEPGQTPILGLPTCKRMELIKRVDAVTTERSSTLPPLVREFAGIFSGIGKLAIEHDIKLASGENFINPVVCAAGRLPFRLEENFFQNLDSMVKDGIITPVSEPTE